MFSFEILNHPEQFFLDSIRIEKIFQLVSETIMVSQKGILNIAFLSDEEIQKLNFAYRGIDKSTDVLSFHYFDDFSFLSSEDIAGECIFSEGKILSQSSQYLHSPREEFEILLIHSLLHILGYDHESDEEYASMWKYEYFLREQMQVNITR